MELLKFLFLLNNFHIGGVCESKEINYEDELI